MGKTDPGSEDVPDKRIAIYIRVSTVYQADRDSLPMQRKDLVSYCELMLGSTDYEIFEDAGYSGKNTDRPAFQDMMSRIRKGGFTHLLVWKIDRISRNLLDFAEMYAELRRLHVTFVSKNEQFDTSTAIGEAMLKIILIFAELERNMTSERVTATMISRANSGLWNGGRTPYGYDYDPDAKDFSVNEREAEICRLLRDDYLKNRSLQHTARYLNQLGSRTRTGSEWSPTSVWIIATSPFYTGDYRYNRYKGTEHRSENPESEWVIVPDHHPAIFTHAEYDAMSEILEKNGRSRNSLGRPREAARVHLFGGLAYCARCGSRMTATPGKLHADGYRPSNYTCPKRRRTHECDNPTVTDTVVGEFVINYLVNMINAKKMFSAIPDPASLERQLLSGATFADVEAVGSDGLNDFYNILSRYRSDDSFVFSARKPKKKKAAVDPEYERLRKEKEKQERALQRLLDLYLYGGENLPEKDYILRRKDITSRLDEINSQLGMISHEPETVLSDEDFIRQASNLLISKELSGRSYVYFERLAKSVSPEVLREYLCSVIDCIRLDGGRVESITFRNGLTHRFTYKK